MTRTLRGLAVVVAVGLAVPLWAVPAAHAAAVQENASSGGYFSAAGLPDTGTDAGKPPNLTAEADGVPPGHLAVAGGNGAEQKVSFLFFGLDEAGFGASITSAELRVPLTPSGGGALVFGADPIKVRACTAGPEGFGGEDGESIVVAPQRLCETAQAPGRMSADGKAYVFDITTIAAGWGEANDGVALTVAEGAAPFQVVFQPAEEASLTYEFTAAPDDFGGGFDGGGSADLGGGFDDSGSADLGGGFDGGFDSGFDGGFSPAPDDGGFGAVDAPSLADGELPAPEPETAGEAPSVAAPAGGARPVAFGESITPTAGFWLTALLFAAALAFLSLVMGDPRLPRTDTRQSRLSRALQSGSTSGLGAGA